MTTQRAFNIPDYEGYNKAKEAFFQSESLRDYRLLGQVDKWRFITKHIRLAIPELFPCATAACSCLFPKEFKAELKKCHRGVSDRDKKLEEFDAFCSKRESSAEGNVNVMSLPLALDYFEHFYFILKNEDPIFRTTPGRRKRLISDLLFLTSYLCETGAHGRFEAILNFYRKDNDWMLDELTKQRHQVLLRLQDAYNLISLNADYNPDEPYAIHTMKVMTELANQLALGIPVQHELNDAFMGSERHSAIEDAFMATYKKAFFEEYTQSIIHNLSYHVMYEVEEFIRGLGLSTANWHQESLTLPAEHTQSFQSKIKYFLTQDAFERLDLDETEDYRQILPKRDDFERAIKALVTERLIEDGILMPIESLTLDAIEEHQLRGYDLEDIVRIYDAFEQSERGMDASKMAEVLQSPSAFYHYPNLIFKHRYLLNYLPNAIIYHSNFIKALVLEIESCLEEDKGVLDETLKNFLMSHPLLCQHLTERCLLNKALVLELIKAGIDISAKLPKSSLQDSDIAAGVLALSPANMLLFPRDVMTTHPQLVGQLEQQWLKERAEFDDLLSQMQKCNQQLKTALSQYAGDIESRAYLDTCRSSYQSLQALTKKLLPYTHKFAEVAPEIKRIVNEIESLSHVIFEKSTAQDRQSSADKTFQHGMFNTIFHFKDLTLQIFNMLTENTAHKIDALKAAYKEKRLDKQDNYRLRCDELKDLLQATLAKYPEKIKTVMHDELQVARTLLDKLPEDESLKAKATTQVKKILFIDKFLSKPYLSVDDVNEMTSYLMPHECLLLQRVRVQSGLAGIPFLNESTCHVLMDAFDSELKQRQYLRLVQSATDRLDYVKSASYLSDNDYKKQLYLSVVESDNWYQAIVSYQQRVILLGSPFISWEDLQAQSLRTIKGLYVALKELLVNAVKLSFFLLALGVNFLLIGLIFPYQDLVLVASVFMMACFANEETRRENIFYQGLFQMARLSALLISGILTLLPAFIQMANTAEVMFRSVYVIGLSIIPWFTRPYYSLFSRVSIQSQGLSEFEILQQSIKHEVMRLKTKPERAAKIKSQVLEKLYTMLEQQVKLDNPETNHQLLSNALYQKQRFNYGGKALTLSFMDVLGTHRVDDDYFDLDSCTGANATGLFSRQTQGYKNITAVMDQSILEAQTIQASLQSETTLKSKFDTAQTMALFVPS